MNADAVERDVRRIVAQWAFIKQVETIDKTDLTIKLRLHVDTKCFVQVYANPDKQLSSYTLVLNRSRVFGRNCEGGVWHRHPAEAPEEHDFSFEGRRAVPLDELMIMYQPENPHHRAALLQLMCLVEVMTPGQQLRLLQRAAVLAAESSPSAGDSVLPIDTEPAAAAA